MTKPLTDARLAEMEALASDATPGPWKCGRYKLAGDPAFEVVGPSSENRRLIVQTVVGDARCPEHTLQEQANAQFVAASREAVPALIAEVRRLRETLEAIAKETGEQLLECDNARDRIELIDCILNGAGFSWEPPAQDGGAE